MTRFAVTGDALSVLSNDSLNIFEISDATNPSKVSTVGLRGNIEMIFPYSNYIFFGTTTGMLIYDNSTPFAPNYISTYSHIRSCDPVVVQGDYAYVTLRNGTECWQGLNSLDIIDLKNITDPQLVKSYDMVNPYGLGIDGNNCLFATVMQD
jgi:hypothetical protein